MGSITQNALFAKTAPYKYAKHFNLTSVLDGLQGFRVASGQGVIDDSTTVFGELKPREKPKLSENKYFTRQVIKKPKRYNPYSRPEYDGKAYRPDNYEANYGPQQGEEESSESTDFFSLSEAQQSVQSFEKNAFPGYQAYDAVEEKLPSILPDYEDDLPPPSLDDIPSNSAFDVDSPSNENGDDASDSNVDFYSQLEHLARKGDVHNPPETLTSSTKKSKAQNGQERLSLPEMELEKWNYNSHKYRSRQSSLLTYKCWKCKRTGHLAEDCTAFIGVAAPSAANPDSLETPLPPPGTEKGMYTPELRRMHAKCQKIGQQKGGKCGECGARANLAQCLDCGVVVCDNKGHLLRHLRDNPSHHMLYSYKLRRQIKCCKSTCSQMNVYKLHTCAECMDKCFERHYSMMNATWSGAGLKFIPNAICCDEHFEWHRINCANSRTGYSAHVVEKSQLNDSAQLSEILF